jgi:glycosyltransferase involved in cell wall biosynthesis
MFSVIIPTFNNIKYLKLCLKSLKKNSKFNHEIIIHINEGSDGTLKFVKDLGLKYSYSKKNEGVCVAFNKAAAKSSKKFLVLGHDDMYFCPLWDLEFEKEIKKLNHTNFFISGTMVQYFNGLIDLDCGKDPESFNENKLLSELPKIKFNDFQGTHWQPSLIAKSTWDSVGGFSNEFSPGLGSDPDFNMKLWNKGIRVFKGLGNCRVYHFSSTSLRKKAWNNGSKTFLIKWGISIKFFKKHYLQSATMYDGPLVNPKKNIVYFFDLIKTKIKLFYLILIDNSNNEKINR